MSIFKRKKSINRKPVGLRTEPIFQFNEPNPFQVNREGFTKEPHATLALLRQYEEKRKEEKGLVDSDEGVRFIRHPHRK